jgi:hypothetical protein
VNSSRCRSLLVVTALVLVAAMSARGEQPADAGRWENDVRKFEAADGERPPAPGGVLFIGSSSVRLWTTLQSDFPSLRVINRGVGGSHIPEITALAHRIVIPYKPRLIVFYCGSNDLASGRSAEQVISDFRAFVSRIHGVLPDVRIAFVSIASNPARAMLGPSFTEVNRAIERYATADPRVDYIDVNTAMLGADGQPRPDIFVDDQLHMNETGYRGHWPVPHA